jgi:hypothetical protein
MVGLTFIGRPILRWAHRSYSSCLEPKPVVCVNQLVVALPLAAIALDYAPDNPFIRRRPRGRVSQISNVALDGCLAMTPDSLRFSESHCGSPHLIGQCCVPTSMRCQLCVRLCTLSRSFRHEEMCFHHRFGGNSSREKKCRGSSRLFYPTDEGFSFAALRTYRD